MSSVGPPNSASRKGHDNRCGEDGVFDVLPLQKPSIVQIESSLIEGLHDAVRTYIHTILPRSLVSFLYWTV